MGAVFKSSSKPAAAAVASQAPSAAPSAAPAAPSSPLANMAQAARDMVGQQLRRRGRAANILAGEGSAAQVGQKRLLGE